MVALEHYGHRFEHTFGQMAARSKGLNCRQDQRTQVLKPGAFTGALTNARPGAKKNFPTVLSVQTSILLLIINES